MKTVTCNTTDAVNELDVMEDKQSQPVFTQSMSGNGELPPIGSKFNHQGRIVKTLSTSSEEGGVVTFLDGTDIGCCWNNSSWVIPIDTRTNKEKAIDYMKYAYEKGNSMEDVLSEITKGYVVDVKWVGE